MPNQPNAFFMYMREQQKKLRDNTGRAYSMKELPGICRDGWKNLSAVERNKYDALAKAERSKDIAGGKGYAKMDSHRQIIADRKDPIKEEKLRREKEVRLMLSSWAGRDLRDITFYVIDFQVMYDDIVDKFHIPMEIGLVSMTMRDGIINYMHRLINPGDPPVGNRCIAQKHSEQTHQIPLNYEHADSDFPGLCNQMKKFIALDPHNTEVPPVFCLSMYRHQVEECLEFILGRANVAPFINKVYCVEDLLSTLLVSAGKTEAAKTQVQDVFMQNRFDYAGVLRCSYHNECDCKHCSLSIARRYCYFMFDILAKVLDFKLSKNHVPENSDEQGFTVTELGGFDHEPEPGSVHWNKRDDRGRRKMSSPTRSPPSFQPAGRGRGQVTNSWQTVDRKLQEVRLSDESNDEDENKHDDDIEDDSEEDESEVKAPQQQYTLKELRKPKSSSMVHTNLSTAAAPTQPTSAEDSVPPGYAAAFPSVRPLGTQMAGVRPMGLMDMNQRYAAPGAGFRGRPLGPQPVVPPPAAWPALSRQGGTAPSFATTATVPPRPMGRGFSSTRGRGYAAKQ